MRMMMMMMPVYILHIPIYILLDGGESRRSADVYSCTRACASPPSLAVNK